MGWGAGEGSPYPADTKGPWGQGLVFVVFLSLVIRVKDLLAFRAIPRLPIEALAPPPATGAIPLAGWAGFPFLFSVPTVETTLAYAWEVHIQPPRPKARLGGMRNGLRGLRLSGRVR
jgi:hypothetical protein